MLTIFMKFMRIIYDNKFKRSIRQIAYSILIVILTAWLGSCNLNDAIKKSSEINSDLSSKFEYKKLKTTIGFGSDDEDNYVLVTFFNFNFDKSESEMSYLAIAVKNRILELHPEFKNIQIRFTKNNESDESPSFVTFSYKN